MMAKSSEQHQTFLFQYCETFLFTKAKKKRELGREKSTKQDLADFKKR